MKYLAILYYTVKSMTMAVIADGFKSSINPSKQPTTSPIRAPIVLFEQPRWPEPERESWRCHVQSKVHEWRGASAECFKAHGSSIDPKGNNDKAGRHIREKHCKEERRSRRTLLEALDLHKTLRSESKERQYSTLVVPETDKED